MNSSIGPGTQWTEPDGVHIEVRGLAPPAPFVTILTLLDSLAARDDVPAVVVHHNRDPLPLYAELAQRGWQAQRIEGEPGEFRLRLSRSV